jgi:dihydroflavonol-4-reductase
VVVLGGTGFIGSHLVESLLAAGHPVRIASRRDTWPFETKLQNTEFRRLDLAATGTEADLDSLLTGSSLIFNVTGALQRPGTMDNLYQDLHVSGTVRLLAALERQVAGGHPVRLVHVSTTGVLGPTGAQPQPETAPRQPHTIYERTKAAGEQLALAGRQPGLQVVIARPGLVYGPRDLHLLGLFKAIASGTFRLIAGGRACWQPVEVDDVVEGLLKAGSTPDVDGEIFHLAGEQPVTIAEFTAAIAGALHTRLRGPSLPRPLAWMAGAVLEAGCVPLGIDPPLSRMRVVTLTQDRRYAIDHARRRLHWEPQVPLDKGLASAAAWYRQQGLLAAAA